MRVRSLLVGLVFLLSFVVAAQADTLKMKNGTTIKGKVIHFNNKEFTILIEGTSSRAIISADDIESIDFDNSSPVVSPITIPKPNANQGRPNPQSNGNVNNPPRTTQQNEEEDDSESSRTIAKGSVPNVRSVTISVQARMIGPAAV